MAENTRAFDLDALVQIPPALRSVEGKLSEQALTALKDYVLRLGNKINGLISFGSAWVQGRWAGNIDGHNEVVVSHGTPNTTFDFYHGLGRVPLGRIIVDQNGAGSLIGVNRASWTEKKMQFKSDGASVTFYVVIV